MTTAQRTEDRDGNRHYLYPPTGELLVSVTTLGCDPHDLAIELLGDRADEALYALIQGEVEK